MRPPPAMPGSQARFCSPRLGLAPYQAQPSVEHSTGSPCNPTDQPALDQGPLSSTPLSGSLGSRRRVTRRTLGSWDRQRWRCANRFHADRVTAHRNPARPNGLRTAARLGRVPFQGPPELQSRLRRPQYRHPATRHPPRMGSRIGGAGWAGSWADPRPPWRRASRADQEAQMPHPPKVAVAR